MFATTPSGSQAIGQPPLSEQPGYTRALGLLAVDSMRWPHDWAQWRIRFVYDNDHRGLGYRDIGAFLRESVLPHCQKRAEGAEVVLYLEEHSDVLLVYRAFGAVRHGPGTIATIQSQAAYRQAAQMAADLVSAQDADGEDADTLALPDLSWAVVGFGQARVATAQAHGHTVVVRIGMVGGQDVWLVDVNGHSGCAQFRLRLDAMSKMGVAAALKAYQRRLRKGPM